MEPSDHDRGRPLALDRNAKSADETIPAFVARPSSAPVYHGFDVLEDVVIDGFTLGLITAIEEEGATEGDAFIIARDNSRAGLVWEFSADQLVEEICPIQPERWGVWGVSFPFRMANRADARRNLKAILPTLKPKWEEWRRLFGRQS